MKGVGLQLPRATVGVSRWRRFRASVDWPLILTIVALCGIGLLNLYSATRGVRHQAKFEAQVQWMVVGSIAPGKPESCGVVTMPLTYGLTR